MKNEIVEKLVSWVKKDQLIPPSNKQLLDNLILDQVEKRILPVEVIQKILFSNYDQVLSSWYEIHWMEAIPTYMTEKWKRKFEKVYLFINQEQSQPYFSIQLKNAEFRANYFLSMFYYALVHQKFTPVNPKLDIDDLRDLVNVILFHKTRLCNIMEKWYILYIPLPKTITDSFEGSSLLSKIIEALQYQPELITYLPNEFVTQSVFDGLLISLKHSNFKMDLARFNDDLIQNSNDEVIAAYLLESLKREERVFETNLELVIDKKNNDFLVFFISDYVSHPFIMSRIPK